MAAVFACIRMQENSKIRNDLIKSYNQCLNDVKQAQKGSFWSGKKNEQQQVIDKWECD
jgi:hypothetical protein